MNLRRTCKLPYNQMGEISLNYIVSRCEYDMEPGSYVYFTVDGRVAQCSAKDAEGVVNPFIQDIRAGEEVIVFLFPELTKDEALADSEALYLNRILDDHDNEYYFVRNFEVLKG